MSAYSEKELVEGATMEVLASLGWETATGAGRGAGEGFEGRESQREVVLPERLGAALARLNPDVPAEAITQAIEELARDRTAMTLAAANREVHKLLTEGVPLDIKNPRTGREEPRTLRVVDWAEPEANDFVAVQQVSLQGPLYRCIPDVVLFVNGLPLVVIELKRGDVPVREAYDENLSRYKHPQNGVPRLLAFNALLIASNGHGAKVGSLTASWERFFEWKRIASEDEPRRVSLEVLLRGTCDKARLLDLVRNFTLYCETERGLAKIVAQNHQFHGVNNAINHVLAVRSKATCQGGVFWQTQGSGKSFSMVFYAEKILRTVPGNWTFVIVTDRIDLDDQIAKTFAACGAAADAKKCHAESGAHLRELLSANHRYVFTIIHKFQSDEVLTDRRDVIVIADEAHRSQYKDLAMNMRAALPNAMFVAFTGTPLILGEEKTREVFGDYVSRYDFQQSIEDGATVPLFYENRTEPLRLENPDLNDEIYTIIDDADPDAEDEARLQKRLGQRYHLMTRGSRFDAVASDIVEHFLGRGFQGKAMVVSIDKTTTLRTYDKVRRAWKAEAERVDKLITYDLPQGECEVLQARLRRLREVEMAIVVSGEQTEAYKTYLDKENRKHQETMLSSTKPLEDRFRDPKDPFAIVFVCAMWLTGFDAPSVSTVYLDKPMRNHTLMQTIARANRVYPGKYSGAIVDYANVFASLEKALAIYGKADTNVTPVRDIVELGDTLAQALADLDEQCLRVGIRLAAIEAATPAEQISKKDDAANRLLATEELKKAFLTQARLVQVLYEALKPHERTREFRLRVATVGLILQKIDQVTHPDKDGPSDLSAVLAQIGEVLDRSIVQGTGGVLRAGEGSPPIDLSRIDFEALARRFDQSATKNLDIERLKAAIRARLGRLIAVNQTRVDLLEKYNALIDEYNAGSAQIGELFKKLVEFTSTLSDEESRHVREQLSEEELVIFDLLTRPGPELSDKERAGVKALAKKLLAKLPNLTTMDWQKTRQGQSRVKNAIEDALDDDLPRAYSPDVFKAKAAVVFQHVYERYGRAA